MRNKIYYLLVFHIKCTSVARYGNEIINNYCNYVNSLLHKYFNVNEQIQLKLNNFDINKLYKFAYDTVEDISFDNIDENTLYIFFEDITTYSL
jgi:hypothetical protein